MAATVQQSEQTLVIPGKGPAGTCVFSLLCKRTYEIVPGRAARRMEQACPLVESDQYYDGGDAENSTVQFESDLVPYKLATDIVLVGKAYAPGGSPVSQIEVGIDVAGHRKIIRVFGDRQCKYRKGMPPAFTETGEFTEMPLRYERAYGGSDLRSDPAVAFYYPRNPMGTGLIVKNLPESVDGVRLPNLEDPKDLLTPERIILQEPGRWNDQPLPQGMGWFHKAWYPRCSFVGSVPGFVHPDQVMREESLGLVPQGQIALARQFKLPSWDLRFNSGASPGLSVPYLKGDETVKLLRLTPDAKMEFSLPADPPAMMLDIGLGQNQLEPVLHTVCIRPEDMQVDLVWRGAHEYPGVEWLAEMKGMVAEIS